MMVLSNTVFFVLLCSVINQATYIGSFPSVEKLPKSSLPEIAFAGRSNVGKSSLINFLTGRKKLAQVSGTPGKTQMINQFLIDEQWKLVDLPGYGYAKLSKKHRDSLAKMIDGYLLGSPNLYLVVILVDSRIPPQKIDLDFMYRLGENGIPLAICFTKCDKTDEEHQERMNNYQETLYEYWEELPPLFQTSSKKSLGKEEFLDWLNNNVNLD